MAGTYSVTATVNGCTSVAGTTTVTVNSKPTVVLSSDAGTLAYDKTATLTGTPSDGIYRISSYTTANSPIITSDGYGKVKLSATSAGTVNVKYDYTDPVTGCSASAEKGISFRDPLLIIEPETIRVSACGIGQNETIKANNEYGFQIIDWDSWIQIGGYTPTGSVNSYLIIPFDVNADARDQNPEVDQYDPYSQRVGKITVGVKYNGVGEYVETKTITVIQDPYEVRVAEGSSTTICPGSTTKLDGLSTPSATNPWQSSDISVATVDGNGLVTGIAGGSAVISFTNSNGCSTTTTVTVNGLPTPTEIEGGASSVCVDALTLPFTNSYSGGTWSIIDGTGSASISSNGVVKGLSAGTVTVVYSFNYYCPNTATRTITVEPLPAALVLTGSTICESQGNNGEITSSSSVSGVNYQLYNSGGSTVHGAKAGTGSGLTWSGLAAGTDYYVVGTNTTTQCSSANSNEVNITTIANPTANINSTANTICSGDSLTLTANSATGCLWSTDETTPQITVKPTSTETYTLTVTQNGCTSLADSVTVTVIQPLVILADVPVNATYFGASNGQITINSITGGSGEAIQLALDGNVVNANFQGALTIDTLSAGTHYLLATQTAGCNSDTVWFEINQPQTFTFTASVTRHESAAGAADGIILIESINAAQTLSFEYTINNGETWSPIAQGGTITGRTAGTYTIVLRTGSIVSEPVELTVEQTCNSYTIVVNDSTQCGDTKGTIYIEGLDPDKHYEYQLIPKNKLGKPVITLLGNNPLTWDLGEIFTDPGATAYDEKDGDITSAIIAVSTVDINTAGTYQVAYNVTDSDGNVAEEVVRVVNVEEVQTGVFTMTTTSTSSTWSPQTVTNSGATLHWEVTGAVTASVDANQPTFNFSTPGEKFITVTSTDGLAGVTNLSCGSTSLTTLDVTGLSNLIGLLCNNNSLTNLNVTGLSNMTILNCEKNSLTTLDVTGLSNLIHLHCSHNSLTTLDVTGLSNLTYLYCYDNNLTTLDVTGLSNLTDLYCYDNNLTILDVTGLINLTHLRCDYNSLTTLDVTGLINLTDLRCDYNSLTTSSINSILDQLIAIGNSSGNYMNLQAQTGGGCGDAAKIAALDAIWGTVQVDACKSTPPVITLLGNNPLTWSLGETFVDPGATALDGKDGDITSSIVATSTVDIDIEGTYQVAYNVTDSDGNAAEEVVRVVTVAQAGPVFEEVTIGTQTWMAVNLDVDDGLGGIYAYNNDENNVATYGRLYNWYAAMRVAASIDGWHLPSDAEWTTLTDYLGGITIAGGKLKEAGTTYWASPNTGATNETGFTALPGGTSTFYGIGKYGYWWSAMESSATSAWFHLMSYSDSGVSRSFGNKGIGFSVRLVKDYSHTPTISLIGEPSITINVGDTYTDAGATATDTRYGDITSRIVTVNNVNTAVAGTYTVTYTVTTEDGYNAVEKVRTVIVLSETQTYIGNKVYNTVSIGTQTWLVENLAYNDGGTGIAYPDNKYSNVNDYGYLYSYNAATRIVNGISGWHIPSQEEFETLRGFIMDEIEITHAERLKESGTAHWLAPNTGANNSTGFSARGAGCKEYAHALYFKDQAWFLTTSDKKYMLQANDYNQTSYHCSWLGYNNMKSDYNNYYYSVRLIKD